MNINSIPKLENIAAAQIAIKICNEFDVNIWNKYLEEKLAYILNFQLNNKQWRQLQGNIFKKICSLGLPTLLQNKISSLVRPILLEIEQWKEDHCEISCTYIDLQVQFRWNIDGTINRKKTAKALVKLEKFDIRKRFVLACFYFFEDDILLLWQKLSFYYEDFSVYDTSASQIVRYWINKLKGQELDGAYLASECILYPPPDLFPRNALVFSSFLHLLPRSQKIPCLIYQINRRIINRSDMFSCLSMLEGDECLEVFKACAENLLRHFINWPLQNHFVTMANSLWPYLSENNFLHLLEFIIRRRIMQEWSDFDYIDLLKEFWCNSPDEFKEFIKGKKIFKSLMDILNRDMTKRFPRQKLYRGFWACPASLFNALRLSCTRSRTDLFNPL